MEVLNLSNKNIEEIEEMEELETNLKIFDLSYNKIAELN